MTFALNEETNSVIIAIFKDGKIIEANDYNDFVELLADHTQESLKEYTEGTTRRSKLWDGSEIAYSNTDEFVSELLRVKVIKEIVVTSKD